MAQNEPESGASAPSEGDLVAGLFEVTGTEERGVFIEAHPELLEPSVVEEVCRRAAEATAADPVRGAQVAAAARDLAERLGDDSSIGLSLRAQANALLYQRDYRAAKSSYEQALERFEAASDQIGAAVTRSIGLHSLCHLGDYETALEWAALARAALQGPGDRLHLARLEQNVATVLSRQDKFEKALRHFQFAYETFLELGEPRHIGVTLKNIAVCHQDLNDFHASLRAYEKAREYCQAHGLTLYGLEVEYNVGYLFYLRGEYTEALRRFERARLNCQEHGDPHHAALCDLDQAEIYLELNLVEEAVDLAAAAHEAFEHLGMTYEAAKALAYGGIAAGRLGNLDQAIERLDQSHEIFQGQENLVWLGMVDFYRARLLRTAGFLKEATGLARKAHSAFSAASVPSRTALSEIQLARLALEAGDPDEARRLSAAVLDRVSALGMPEIEYQAHLVAGQVADSANERQHALAAYRRSLDALERQRFQLAGEELKIAFLGGKQALFGALVRLTLEGGTSAEALSEAFGYVERAKSSVLTDLLAGAATRLEPRSAVDPDLAATVQDLREEVNWYYRRIDRDELVAGELSTERVNELRREVAERERRLQREQQRLQALDPELAAAEGAEVVDLESLRQVLPADTLLLEYYSTEDGLYVCLIDQDGIKIRLLPVFEELSKILGFLDFQLRRFALGPERVGEHVHQSTRHYLRQLYDALIAPVRDELCDRRPRHLVVVPHGALHQVPFSALHDGERYLMDDYEISYAPSATVFALCAKRVLRPEPRELVMGVPDLRAPQILDEVQAVAENLPNARLLVGEKATRESLATIGRSCRIVHLATHGHFRHDNPMFSALQLADSRLSLFDLYGLRFNADLVVLSGCGTGLGVVSGGDELIGLTRGMLYAGSRAVLATLWDVNDESTREFMVSFYRNLEAEPHPAAALRAAQLELRERFPEPYYWAPFLLVGWPFEPHAPAEIDAV